MNNKGQIGVLMVTFITILVGVILFTAIAQQVGTSTTLDTFSNYSVGTVTNGTVTYVAGYKHIASPVIVAANGSGTDFLLASGNYTITNNVINPTTGELTVSILPAESVTSAYNGNEWKVSGVTQKTTYISDSGGRAVAGIIAIFFALAVAIVALSPTLRGELAGMMNR